MPMHAHWMFYLDLDSSFPMTMHNDHSSACAADALPGLGQESPNTKWLRRFLSHAYACAVELLPGLGPELSNAM
jgi:hypothetical protein